MRPDSVGDAVETCRNLLITNDLEGIRRLGNTEITCIPLPLFPPREIGTEPDLFSLLFLGCHGRRSGGRAPFLQQIAVDGSLIQKELGFVPQYDLKAGWEETIREMRGKNKY